MSLEGVLCFRVIKAGNFSLLCMLAAYLNEEWSLDEEVMLIDDV